MQLIFDTKCYKKGIFNFSDRIAYYIINGWKILQFSVLRCGVRFLFSIVIDGVDLVKVLFDEKYQSAAESKHSKTKLLTFFYQAIRTAAKHKTVIT